MQHDPDTADPEAAAQAPRPVPPRRLTRSTDRHLAGVSGGIADYFAVDATIVRLGFIVAALLGGIGVAAYLICWAVLPDAGCPPSTSPRTVTGNARLIGALVVAGLVVVIADRADRTLWLPVALLGGGIYLLSRQASETAPPPVADPKPPPPTNPPSALPEHATMAWAPTSDPDTTRASAPLPPPETPTRPPAPAEPAIVTRIVLSLVAVVVAVGIIIGEVGWLDVEAAHVLGAALVVVGIGVVAGSLMGRMRGLVAIGATMAVGLAATMFAGPLLEDGVGERSYVITTLEELREEYVHGIGELVVDLRQLEVPDGESAQIHLELGIGHAVVWLPEQVDVLVAGDVGIGELELFGEATNGMGNEDEVAIDATSTSATIVIDLEVGIGHGEVRRG